MRRVAGLLALPLLAGCGGGGGGGTTTTPIANPITPISTPTPTPTPVPTPIPTPTASTASATTAHGLTATLAEDRSTVAVGSAVTYTLTLTNSTSAAVSILSASSGTPTVPAATLLIKNAAGAVVYPTPASPPDGPPINFVTFASGQSLTRTIPASVFAAGGAYTATASFPDDQPQVVVGPVSVTAQ